MWNMQSQFLWRIATHTSTFLRRNIWSSSSNQRNHVAPRHTAEPRKYAAKPHRTTKRQQRCGHQLQHSNQQAFQTYEREVRHSSRRKISAQDQSRQMQVIGEHREWTYQTGRPNRHSQAEARGKSMAHNASKIQQRWILGASPESKPSSSSQPCKKNKAKCEGGGSRVSRRGKEAPQNRK